MIEFELVGESFFSQRVRDKSPLHNPLFRGGAQAACESEAWQWAKMGEAEVADFS